MIFFVLFIATVFAANWAIASFGIVPVGFGLMAPAGVYFAGLAFVLRDLTQEWLGRRFVLAAIVLGALLSAAVSPQFALASGAAFLFSELCDFAVYTPLRKKNFLGAVFASNLVGSVVDSAIFLLIGFGSMEFFAGQVVGKMWVTLAFLPVLWGVRDALLDKQLSRRPS